MIMKTLAIGIIVTLLSGCQSTLLDKAAPASDSAITAKTDGQGNVQDRQAITQPTQNTLKPKHTAASIATNTAIDASMTTTLTPELLAAYHWSLLQANDRQQQPLQALLTVKSKGMQKEKKKEKDKDKQTASLHFQHSSGQNTLHFGVGCNGMGGVYTLHDNVLETAGLMSTKMMCSEDLNQAEVALSKAMQGRSVLSLKVNEVDDTAQLTQQTVNGDILLWQGSKILEAAHGQTATVVFWEIKAQQPQCPDATMTSCLSVRPVYYDAQGIKIGVGDWQLFAEGIAGYTHDKDVQSIVRLKRFVTHPIDVKGKQYVYVLDNVIESRTAE